MAVDAGLWSPRRPHADSRLRADARGRDADRINAVLAAAGYNVDAWLQWGPAPTTAYGWLAGKRGMAGQRA